MRFYSKIVDKPESVSTQVKDVGGKGMRTKKLCEFFNGIAEVDDPNVIKKLKAHPEMYRTDKPWPTNYWQDTKEGKVLIKRGKQLNIDCRHIRKSYLISLIKEIEAEKKLEKNDPVKNRLDYPELVARAEILGISTHKKKKEDLLADIEAKEKSSEIDTKEVIINARS